MSNDVLYEVHEGLALVTLNRPEQRNALSLEALGALRGCVTSAASDRRVRALTLRAAGPVFCAGLDLKAVDVGRPEEAAQASDALAGVYRSLLTFPIPVFCAVAGVATGGGVGLVAAADLVWAGPRASFALPESRVGLVPALVSVVLRRRLSPKKLLGMALTGIVLDRAEAHAAGLVDILAESGLDAEVDLFARTLFRDHSAGAIRRTKDYIDRRNVSELEAELEAARSELRVAAATEEAHRGLTAFRRKETVRWDEE